MKRMPRLQGKLQVPGDKSISHRALIFAALSRGTCLVRGLSSSEDCQSTIACLRQLGLAFVSDGAALKVVSPGLDGLRQPEKTLDAGNSGTTMRLLPGLVAGGKHSCVFDGDQSLRKRPMKRVLAPLVEMGARVQYLYEEGFAPFTIAGGDLEGRDFKLTLASAQVQTCLILAGLQARGRTMVCVAGPVRDHSVRLLKAIGVHLLEPEPRCTVVERLAEPLLPFAIDVPGDISSAAFFMVAASLLPGSDVTLVNVGLNPGRILVIDVLKRMGATIQILNQQEVLGEPVADVQVRYSGRLGGADITAEEVAAGIDEIPILALAGALCQGAFTVRGAGELRVKESDRIAAMVANLSAAGADVVEKADGLIIAGRLWLQGNSLWQTHGDHRLAMVGAIASLVCRQPLEIDDSACARISYPAFQEDLDRLLG